VSIEEDLEALGKGDKQTILGLFARLERFITKIAGKKAFEFEAKPEVPQRDQIAPSALSINIPSHTSQPLSEALHKSDSRKPSQSPSGIMKNKNTSSDIPSPIASPLHGSPVNKQGSKLLDQSAATKKSLRITEKKNSSQSVGNHLTMPIVTHPTQTDHLSPMKRLTETIKPL
jgi:hypothetical protein